VRNLPPTSQQSFSFRKKAAVSKIDFFLTLSCPFCRAPEAGRVAGVDDSGATLVLLMFDCPFSLKVPQSLAGTNEATLQTYLEEWRSRHGEAWLESVGPILKNRELRNMEQSRRKRVPASST
jgi:hypothetical protein